jgi:ketosteroid isomerase-like protein
MRRIASRIVLSVIIAGAVSALPASALASDVRKEVDAGNARILAGMAAKDTGAIAAVYAEDAVLYPPGAPAVSGRKAIGPAWEPMLGLPLSLKTSEVKQSGDLAIETGTWTLAGPDGSLADDGKYLVVWKRSGKKWLIWRDIWNTSRPPPKP